MKKEDIINPTPDEVAKRLESIEEATLEEEYERKRLGLSLEPKAKQVPRDLNDSGVRPVEKEKGMDLGGYIKKWQEANSGYVPESIDTDLIDISNTVDAEVPFGFLDYLIGKANDLMKSKNIDLLGEIKQIRVRREKDTKELVVMVKDIRDVVGVFFFEPEPPFGLKKIDSHLGVYTF